MRPADVVHLFPPGTCPDVFDDGMTYVALVPFKMSRTRVGPSPPVPYFGTFAETNIRLYSLDADGRHGVLFLSLETSRLAVVAAVRLAMGIPYTWARMRIDESAEQISYQSQRRWPQRGLRSLLSIRIGDPVTPTPLEVWLTARWGRTPARPAGPGGCPTSMNRGRCVRRRSSNSMTNYWRPVECGWSADRCGRCTPPVSTPDSVARGSSGEPLARGAPSPGSPPVRGAPSPGSPQSGEP